MTTITTTFSIRSFRRFDDPYFQQAIEIYNHSIHHQIKTDTRDIVYWLQNGASHQHAKIYVCGLFEGAQVIGFLQFAYFITDRIIHVDYFVLAEKYRPQGRFFLFAEQFKNFIDKEHLIYDLITAEVPLITEVKGRLGYFEKLIRLLRSIGLGELKVDYYQPLLGWDSKDTSVHSRLMVFFPVYTPKLSTSRYIKILRTIYLKHYREWYRPLYPEHDNAYLNYAEQLINDAEEKLKGIESLDIDSSESEFVTTIRTQDVEAKQQLIWFILKLLTSMGAAAFLHWFLANRTEWNIYLILILVVACFVLVAILLVLRNREQLETVKFFLSIMRDFFNRQNTV